LDWWNAGILEKIGSGILQNWVNGKIPPEDKD
jgi:hypothetical protein